jgi:hypothetical protein
MIDNLKQIHYNDSISDLAAVMEEVGARRFLMDFRHNYPKHFDELAVQINRIDSRKIPVLLQKPDAPTV